MRRRTSLSVSQNLLNALRADANGLIIVAVDTRTRTLGSILTFGADDSAFERLWTSVLTVKALNIIIIIIIVIYVIAKIFGNFVLFFLSPYTIVFTFLRQRKIFATLFGFSDSFLEGHDLRMAVISLVRDTILLLASCVDWNDFCGT